MIQMLIKKFQQTNKQTNKHKKIYIKGGIKKNMRFFRKTLCINKNTYKKKNIIKEKFKHDTIF